MRDSPNNRILENKMTYEQNIATAEQILEASECEYDVKLGWYFILGNKLNYYDLTDTVANQIISETLAVQSIDWFDDNMKEGDIEINGKRITVYFSESQATAE